MCFYLLGSAKWLCYTAYWCNVLHAFMECKVNALSATRIRWNVICVYVCESVHDSLVVGVWRTAALHAKLMPQAVRVRTHSSGHHITAETLWMRIMFQTTHLCPEKQHICTNKGLYYKYYISTCKTTLLGEYTMWGLCFLISLVHSTPSGFYCWEKNMVVDT